MFIAHDMSAVKYFSDRIGVMYFGHMVEMAETDELFASPLRGKPKRCATYYGYIRRERSKDGGFSMAVLFTVLYYSA